MFMGSIHNQVAKRGAGFLNLMQVVGSCYALTFLAYVGLRKKRPNYGNLIMDAVPY